MEKFDITRGVYDISKTGLLNAIVQLASSLILGISLRSHWLVCRLSHIFSICKAQKVVASLSEGQPLDVAQGRICHS